MRLVGSCSTTDTHAAALPRRAPFGVMGSGAKSNAAIADLNHWACEIQLGSS